ncbi:centrosomal protein of 135 kDa-like [Dermacentor silvarum]|uniref:centrosomal protein of 135 kDa-like n=1 Tax=Dermacentor silvarum TaxID=543639 RepID=UPI00189A4E41|nr:centrosomal protein of 135 kDa-like [Dermacentor silvarum]
MDKLKLKRATRRAQNTRIIHEASALLENNAVTLRQIDCIYERLKNNNDELKKINDELESHISEEAFEADYATVIEYEDNATRILAELQSKRRQQSETTSLSSPVGVRDMPVATGHSERPGVKLPKLEINAFDGDLCKWNAFWEQFDQIINQNGTLTATDKFNYLRLFLKGDAATAIAGLPTTEACYVDALDMLKRRFGDKKRLEQEYFSRLRRLTPVRFSNEVTKLRKLYDQVLINTRGLEVLGVSKSSFSSMLCDVLLRALPHDIVVAYHRSCATQAASSANVNIQQATELERLLQFVCIELESLEKSDFGEQKVYDEATHPRDNKNRQFDRSTEHMSSKPVNSPRQPSAEDKQLLIRLELLQREVDKLTATVENLSKQHDRLLVERDSQARQIALLTEKLKEKDKDTQTAHLTCRTTEAHIDKLQDNLNSQESDVVRLTCRVRELETEAASGAESHSHLLQENQRLHENFTLVAKEHKNMASDLENAVQQKKDFELEIQEYVIKVAKIEELLRTTDREREDILDQYRSLISADADLLTQAEQRQKEQDSSDATLNSLRQQLARHMSVTTEQEQKLASLGATMAALQESLLHSAAEGSRLKEELQKSSDMRARLVEQVESLQDQLAKEQTVNNHISGHLRRLTENFWKRWTKEDQSGDGYRCCQLRRWTQYRFQCELSPKLQKLVVLFWNKIFQEPYLLWKVPS